MRILFFVALGGAAGAVARFGVGSWVHSWAGWSMPWGTFAVNALGSLLIGVSLRILEGMTATAELRALVTIGLLGAFTTFSTYAYDTVTLVREGSWGRAGLYAFGSLAVGVLAVVVGFGAAGWLLKARS